MTLFAIVVMPITELGFGRFTQNTAQISQRIGTKSAKKENLCALRSFALFQLQLGL